MNSVPMWYKEGTKFRFVEFPDLTTALASNQLYGYGTIFFIKGDTTRFKVCVGSKVSAKNPAAPTALTFAQLPWINSTTAKNKAPSSDVTIAINATGTYTAAQLLATNYVTSTSAAGTTITLDTWAHIATAFGYTSNALAKGAEIDFEIDNSAGASTVTVAVATGITVPTAVLTGADTLTVAAGTFGKFTLIGKSTTAALLIRRM